jgi:hypothetical protein
MNNFMEMLKDIAAPTNCAYFVIVDIKTNLFLFDNYLWNDQN